MFHCFLVFCIFFFRFIMVNLQSNQLWYSVAVLFSSVIRNQFSVLDDLLREHVGHSQGLGAQVLPVGLIGRHDVLHALWIRKIDKIMFIITNS